MLPCKTAAVPATSSAAALALKAKARAVQRPLSGHAGDTPFAAAAGMALRPWAGQDSNLGLTDYEAVRRLPLPRSSTGPRSNVRRLLPCRRLLDGPAVAVRVGEEAETPPREILNVR